MIASSTNRTKPVRILVLGGGFGGIYTAWHLERLTRQDPSIEITLVSRDNYFLMTPLLFEAGSGVLEPRHAVNPIRPLYEKTRFVEADIEGIDFDRQVVSGRHAPDGHPYELPYDHLVIALGGVTNRKIIPGSDHALAFKTLADAIFVRNRIIDLFEQADVETDPQRRAELLNIVVIGAGLVGVELVGELTEFVDNLLRSYPRIRRQEVQFHLVEASDKVLPEMDRDLAQYAADTLRERGVHIHTSTPVQQIAPERVHLPGGTVLAAHTIVLCAGVAANPLLEAFPLAKGRGGRIAVHSTMRTKEYPNVWALGDCAAIPDPEGNPYPPLAQHALREAKVLAKNLLVVLRGKGQLKPFVYQSMGTLASLGHYAGVGRVWKFKVKGFLAWWIWRTYYVMQMPRVERRIRVILDWTVALLFRNDIVKLELFGQGHPTVTGDGDSPAGHRERSVPARNQPVPH